MRHSPVLRGLLRACALSCAALLGLILVFLVLRSAGFFAQHGALALLTDAGWQPTAGLFNIVPMLAATVIIACGAVVLAAPLGILLALFGRFVCPGQVRRFYIAVIELLAGIPSVVYGLWGLVVLVPLIAAWAPPGASVLAAILVLAIMVLPLMVVSVDNALGQLPRDWLEAGQALALSRWGMIRHVILPASWPAIRSGAVLQTGRALGETMAVLMVCGNVVQIPTSVFDPARTLTANIALEMAYASTDHARALVACGLVLFALSVALVMLAGQGSNRSVSAHA